MLVITKRNANVCSWHLIFTEDEDHISYDDPRLTSLSKVQADTTDIHELEAARHIVEWCHSIQVLTGKPTYNIRTYSILTLDEPRLASIGIRHSIK